MRLRLDTSSGGPLDIVLNGTRRYNHSFAFKEASLHSQLHQSDIGYGPWVYLVDDTIWNGYEHKGREDGKG